MTKIFSFSFLILLLSASVSGQIYGDPIIHWDFDGGIPDTWTNASASGVSHWEFRGPETSPDNTACSLGSCGENSIPPNSVTLNNGFVIFDSNYWDDSVGPCGNIGSGLDPGPHEAWLITEPVDLSNESNLVLTFQQQYKHYFSNDYDIYSSVEISVDGGNSWQLIYQNPGDYAVSPTVEWAGANISEIAGGQSDVRFKFLFTGFYYWWCLDDIIIYVPNQNDLMIVEPKYTEFDFQLPPDGFGDMEYNSYSQIMPPHFNFSAGVTNIGGMTQNNVQLHVSLVNTDNGNEYYSDFSPAISVDPGVTTDIQLSGTYIPTTVLGHYNINFEISQLETDEDPSNNFTTKDYYMDPHTLARDENAMVDQFIPSGVLANEQVEVGNVFHCWEYGNHITSISVALGDSTSVGTEIYGIIYDLARDTVYGQTDPYIVNAWDLNSVGESKFVCLPLQEPIVTKDTLLYLAMVGHLGEPDERMIIGRSGTPPIQSSLIYYPEVNQLFYFLTTSMVRIHIFNPSFSPGCTDPLAMNYDTNAGIDDGCCRYAGCTFESATNFDPSANWEDGSCNFLGCTDTSADNFDPNATEDDGSCDYWGCMDSMANNYDSTANVDDGSCNYDNATMSVSALSGCAPLTVVVNNQTDVMPLSECIFELGDGSTHIGCEDYFEYTYETPGTYTITYNYNVSDFSSQVEIGPIEVFAPPFDPALSYDSETNTISCTNETDWSIQWFLNGDSIPNYTPSFIPTENGLYTVSIIDTNGCEAMSDEIGVIIVGLQEQSPEKEFMVYPNPASSWIQVVAPCRQAKIEIWSAQGQLVHTGNTGDQRTVNLPINLSSAVYTVRIMCNNSQKIFRIVVEE